MLGVNGVVSESCVQLVLRCFISRDDESLETIAAKADGSAPEAIHARACSAEKGSFVATVVAGDLSRYIILPLTFLESFLVRWARHAYFGWRSFLHGRVLSALNRCDSAFLTQN